VNTINEQDVEGKIIHNDIYMRPVILQHFDNIAPALRGGLLRVGENLNEGNLDNDFEKLNLPEDIFFVVFYGGQLNLNTSEMRKKLNSIQISSIDRQRQQEYYLNFLKAIDTTNPNYPDYELMRASMKDIIIEPFRKPYIPLFDTIQKFALEEKNCLGCSLSGSGPSIFAMVRGIKTAKTIKNKWENLQSTPEYQNSYQKKQLDKDGGWDLEPFIKIFVENKKGTEQIQW